MRLVSCISTLALAGGVLARKASTTVEDYIAKESPIAKKLLLNNIGAPVGASPGVVAVASANNTNPIAKYSWIRDAAMAMKPLINEYTLKLDTSLQSTIEDYIFGQVKSQFVPNPAGTVSTGGLAEVKFHLDYSPDTDSWTRPQYDSPPLRANNLIIYAHYLMDQKNTSFVENALWPSISLDLDFIAHHWNETSFELWEVAWTESYWTAALEVRALRSAAILGRKLGRDVQVRGWENKASEILCFMQSFWNRNKNYVAANTVSDRSGLDSATVLASIYNFDPLAGCDPLTLQPCSDKALMNLKAVVDAFRPLYPLNPISGAAAIGLWIEDTTFGDPWHLATFGAAEQLYDALWTWNSTGLLTVTNLSYPFFQQFYSNVKVGSYRAGFNGYQTITDGIRAFADNTVLIAANATPDDGMLPQMFDKTTGQPAGANGLSWSYGGALSAFDARNGLKPASWGARGLVLSCTCGSNIQIAEDPIEVLDASKFVDDGYVEDAVADAPVEDNQSVFSAEEVAFLDRLYQGASERVEDETNVFTAEEVGFLESLYKTAADYFQGRRHSQSFEGGQGFGYDHDYEITPIVHEEPSGDADDFSDYDGYIAEYVQYNN